MCASAHVASLPSAYELFAAIGLIPREGRVPAHLQLFVAQADRALGQVDALVQQGELTPAAAVDFAQLITDACARVLCHPIVARNRYLERFARGVTLAQARHELQQFSVFAAQFDVAQAKLVANAPTDDAYV
ncbi:MAG TPA: hypothetical protein VIK18_10215, partial [Pirellulales bacterium]